MTRIKGSNVQIGSGFVLPLENQHKEELTAIEKMLRDAKAEKERIIKEGTDQAKQLVEEAKQILAQAQEDGKQIVEQANAQADSESNEIRETAKKEGYEEGYKQGYDDGTNALELKVKAVDDFAKSQFELKHNIVKSAELDIVELVCAIARKVCKKSFDNDINILKSITIEAIKQLKDRENITITVNPKLAEKIYSISDELKEEIPKLQTIKIIEDNNISDDGTVIESLLSRVDNRLKIQLDQIVEKFMNAHYSSEEDAQDDSITETECDYINSNLLQDNQSEETLENISEVFNSNDKNED